MKLNRKLAVLIISSVITGCFGLNQFVGESQLVHPVLKEIPTLVYPAEAQKRGIAGEAKIVLCINKNGDVDSVILKSSTGYKILDDAALAW